MKKNNRILLFGYSAIFVFAVLWELTDKFMFSVGFLIVANLLLIFLMLLGLIKPEMNENKSRLQAVLPLYSFVKQYLVQCIVFCFSLLLIQVPMGYPVKNWGLAIFGMEKEGHIVEDDLYIDSTDKGDIEMFYQSAEFNVNNTKYVSYYEEAWKELDRKKQVVVQYLPINPNVNRFREDFTDYPDSMFTKLITLFASLILPCIFLYYLEVKID